MANPTPIIFTLTHAGLNAALNAQNNGLQLKLSKVAVGTGKYNSATAQGRTALATKWGEFALAGAGIEPNSKTLRFSAIIKSATKRDVFEIGLMTDSDVLFAVASTTDSDSLFSVHTNVDYVGAFGISLTQVPVSSIQVVVDTNQALAIALMNQHLAQENPHPQYILKSHILPYLQSLANIIWHVGSWHGSDNLSYNPRTALEPIFGYLTNWELRPDAPWGVTTTADPLLQRFGIAGSDGKKAQSTRIWKRLPDDFNATITASKTIAFESDVITFTAIADSVPDGTVIAYELFGDNITIDDFRETQISKTLKGQIVFYNNQAQVTLTVNSFEFIGDVIYGNQKYDDAGRLKLKLIGVSAAESNVVTLPVVYAGLSEIECIANGGAASTYFVIATRGIPEGTECTVTCDLGGIEENFTIDATGRHIVDIPLIHYFPSDPSQFNFKCSLSVMGKLFGDSGILYATDSGQTTMNFFAPTMALQGQDQGQGFVFVNSSDGQFAERGMIWGAKSGKELTSRTVFNSLDRVTAGKNGSELKVISKQSGNGLSAGQFGVLQVGAEDANSPGPIKPFKTFARLLVYKD